MVGVTAYRDRDQLCHSINNKTTSRNEYKKDIPT